MEITLFDGFVARVGAGMPLTFPSSKVRALAAYLAVHANRPIQRTHLATLFWGDKPDDVALRNLRNSLSRLKKALAPLQAATDGDLLTITRTSVWLAETAVIPIDVAQYDRLWNQCAAVARAAWDTDKSVLSALTELVTLYRGPLLAGLTVDDCAEFDDWLTQQQEHYHQRTLTALETLTQRAIAQQQFEQAERYAKRQLELEVWHETAHRQLIEIYVLTRRPQQAQQQFAHCQRMLREAFGTVPAPETVAALEKRPLVAAERTKRQRHRLAAVGNAFVGREAEVAQVQRLLADGTTRFITLHGEGGIGKTRLARAVGVAAGELFADGVAFVPLVEASQAADIPELLLKALQVRSLGKRDPLVQLHDYLAERQLLLIIDNLEHLLVEEETAVFLLNLLQAAPRLKLLVTSRQQVWVQAETVVRIDGLAIPDPSANGAWLRSEAVQLFAARMRQLDAHFDPTEKREAIIAICRAVQGLPLGIELAVAESHIRSCEAVAQSLRHDLALQTRMRDVPHRQASLQAVFDHSWRLLASDLQRLLAQCAMMRGDFSAAAFVAVTAGRHDQLQRLVDHALVRQVGNDRYDLHEVVRHFALERLETADRATAWQRYAAYFLHLVAEQEEALITDMEPALATIRREWHHIETAWDEAVEKTAVDLFDAAVPALCTYWIITGHASSTLARLEAAHACLAVAAPQPRLAAARAKIEGALIWISFTAGEIAQSIALAQHVLRKAEPGTSEPFPIVVASCTLGSLQMLRGRLAQTEQLLTQGYALAIQHSLPIWQSVATYLMVMLLSNQGRLAECAVWAQRSVDCVAPNRFLQLCNGASWHFRTWELSACMVQAEETRCVLRQLGQDTCIDATFTLVASAYYKCGTFERVVAMYDAARRDVSLDAQQFVRHAGYYVLAHTERRRGNLEAALRYGQLAVKYTTDLAPGFHYFFACDALALVLCALGRPAEAQTLLHTALNHLRGSELADHWYILIEGSLAHSYALAGEWQRATEMAGELVDRLLATDVATTQMEQTWFCYQILARYGDGRAADLLAHMQAVIQQRADRLAPEHRYDFINNFPEHRAVMAQAGVSVVFA